MSNTIFSSNLLLYIIMLLVLFIITLILIPKNQIELIKQLTLAFSLIIFIFTLLLWIFFNNELGSYVYVVDFKWLSIYNVYYSLGIDGVSIFFIILTTFLIPLCILISWNSITYKQKEFMILLLVIELLLINVFSVCDLFFFYIFFESILIPMFIMIGVWGSRQRKIHAAYQFFFYTLLGSILMLLGIILIYLTTGTTDIQMLTLHYLTPNRQIVLWLAFFASFAVKIPMLPVHIWLPEAHVEAPTAGSVILAGVLLKLGTYGIVRFMIPLFPEAMLYFTPLVFTLCVISIIYAAATTIRQIDLKKIIAYSSVVHMNFALLGIFTNTTQGIEGSLFFMLGHGIVSSGLFLCIGMLYDRYHTRNILYYGGLVQTMPLFSVCFLILTFANLGLPGLINFVGEFLVLVATLKVSFITITLASAGLILGAVYGIWLCNRLIYGQLRFYSFQKFIDLNRREVAILVPIIFLVFYMGIYPEIFLNTLDMSTNKYINY